MGLREKCVQPALRNAVFVIIRLQIEKKKKHVLKMFGLYINTLSMCNEY